MALNSHVTTVVRSVVAETPRINRYELSCSDFWELPPFTAGAHIDVVLPDGNSRQYSLCGDPADRHRYQIAVLREDTGRGGSKLMHQKLMPGAVLPVSLPRNLFALSPFAARHIFIAGGIGITPFISMIAELERRGGRYELHYCARSPEDAAFMAMLTPRATRGAVHFYHRGGPGSRALDLPALFQTRQSGDHAYCCGPERLLNGFIEATQDWPAESVHYERFGKDTTAIESPAYDVRLARSNRIVHVAANQPLSAALMAAGAPLKVACEAGVCGNCKVRYLAGSPIHRDLILSDEERLEDVLTCVSGCVDNALVLDL
ncbi:MAG TPA: PDR/VanB family oxidoreductase [Herbaspirillum sp.]|jgi:vanillate O-demethylase ferredoxin subunit